MYCTLLSLRFGIFIFFPSAHTAGYLPKHGIKIRSVELVRHPSAGEFGPEQRDELLEADLAVA